MNGAGCSQGSSEHHLGWEFEKDNESPVKGGIGGIVHPPIGRLDIPLIYHLYTTYSPCLLGGYMLPNYHLLWEPATTMDHDPRFFFGNQSI